MLSIAICLGIYLISEYVIAPFVASDMKSDSAKSQKQETTGTAVETADESEAPTKETDSLWQSHDWGALYQNNTLTYGPVSMNLPDLNL